ARWRPAADGWARSLKECPGRGSGILLSPGHSRKFGGRGAMNRSWNVVAALAVVTTIAACSKKSQPPKQSAAATAASRQPRTAEAAGDVAKDSAAPHDNIKWLSDANVVAMLTAMNQRQVAAADAELSTWHID